jgi:hypothetical protein
MIISVLITNPQITKDANSYQNEFDCQIIIGSRPAMVVIVVRATALDLSL